MDVFQMGDNVGATPIRKAIQEPGRQTNMARLMDMCIRQTIF